MVILSAMLTAAAVCGVCYFSRALYRRIREHRTSARFDQALAVARAALPPSKPPAPFPSARGTAPGPAPPPRHATGPVTATIRVWACGCTHTWDGTGRLTRAMPWPHRHRTLDDELKDLTQ